MTATGWVIVSELSLALAFVLFFLAMVGRPWRAVDQTMAWHIGMFTAAVGLLVGLLLAAVLGWRVPEWLGIGVLGVLDGMLGWRVVLVLVARRDANRDA